MEATNTSTARLKAQQLCCVRNDITLFQDLSFELQAGEILQVEGVNGSGKTSLLRILCGLTTPAEGTVLWQDESIDTSRINYYADMTYVGHVSGLKSNLTCEENLQVASISNHFRDDYDIEAAMEKMEIDDLIDEFAGKLSAGQQRRVALTRLLLSKARLWILDEPFTALDIDSRQRIEQLLDQHCNNGGMAVLTTHHELNVPNTSVKILRINA